MCAPLPRVAWCQNALQTEPCAECNIINGVLRRPLQVASPLLATLVQLHRLGIIHRDIKLENIFIEGSRVKLGDFGLSICTHEEIPAAPVGTLEYMAPEVRGLGLPSMSERIYWWACCNGNMPHAWLCMCACSSASMG